MQVTPIYTTSTFDLKHVQFINYIAVYVRYNTNKSFSLERKYSSLLVHATTWLIFWPRVIWYWL